MQQADKIVQTRREEIGNEEIGEIGGSAVPEIGGWKELVWDI